MKRKGRRQRGRVKHPPKLKKRRGLVLHIEVLGKSQVEFSSHALDRLRQRGIKRDDIIEAINNPTSTGHPTQPGREHIRKSFPQTGKLLDVIYDELPERVRIITAYYK